MYPYEAHEQLDHIVEKIASILKDDNIDEPYIDTHVQAYNILKAAIEQENGEVQINPRRYGQIKTIEGVPYFTIFEKGHNYYPEEIIEQFRLPEDFV